MRFISAILCFLPCAVLAAGVESFTPQGEAREARQIKVRFDADMVPLGDPGLADPLLAQCPVQGSGRWVDSRNWVYDLRRDLPGGVACRFSTRPGLTALDGQAVTPASFAFHTGGPAIVATLPGEGQVIQEDQVFILGLDAPVREATLKERLGCVAEGVAERIPVQRVQGKARRKVLEASAGFFQDYFSTLGARAPIQAPAGGALTRAQILKFASEPNAPILVVQCARRAPAGAKLSLRWEPGIESVSGVATSAAQALEFRIRPDFTARLRCDKLNPRAGCLPILPITLHFSAPVPVKTAQQAVLAGDGRTWKPKLSEARSGAVEALEFAGPFPERANLVLTLPADLRDDAGRALVNARRFPLVVKVDLMPPLAKFAAGFGLYELNADPALPLTVRYVDPLSQGHALLSAKHLVTQNPKEIFEWMRRIKRLEQDEYDAKGALIRRGAETPLFEPRHKIDRLALPKPLPDKETEVIGIPLKGAGFHIVEVASPRLGAALFDKPRPYHVRAAALVTNLAVHFKQGAESSLVWVTSLDGARPVADAEVAVRDCGGNVHVQGKTDANGLWRIARPLPERDRLPGCLDDWDKEFFVTASQGEDFSFTLSGWNEGISPWRFNLFQGEGGGPWLAHAVLDRGLYRAGEEVGIKLIVRKKRANGFTYVEKERLGRQVILRHRGSDDEIKLPVVWDGQGIAEIAYSLPKEIKQGQWDIVVPHSLKGGRETQELSAGALRVAAFRVPTMRARLSGPAQAVNPKSLRLDMQAVYLAGGAASRLPVTLRGQLQALEVSFPDYEDASIANGRVKPGRQRNQDEWQIANYDVEEGEGAPADARVTPLKTQRLTLDGGGAGRAGWDDLPPLDTPRLLRAEAEYRDANGEVKSAAARVPLYPAKVLAGVQPDSWVQTKDSQRFRLIALDPSGKPAANVAMKARYFKRDWHSYRKRVIGGFYAYEHSEEIKPLGDACSGRTDARGVYFCEARAAVSGDLILEVEARDADGNASYAQHHVWVPAGDGWVDASDNDRMDLIPEKRRLEVGETARFHLRMPFESASVLVSVEREGVLDAWVTQVRRDKPVIEAPIKPEYGPNVFVSALAVRGRVAGVQPAAMVDLGKPAFRMGMAEVQVGWSGYALDVKLQADKTRYQTREKARVRVQVRRPDGSTPKNGEIALAAVDEGLLELAPNASWKLLDAMMQRRGIQVTTSTAQMQVVGKRHFGRKAVPAGGGGGRSSARELFDTRVFWQARVKLDEKGEAEVEIPLNDSLTTFRVVAVANAAVGRFGTGETRLPVTQDLQLLSGVAPLVREGDRLKVYFTLRNVSERDMDVEVSPRLSQDGGKTWSGLDASRESLKPGQGREIALPVEVPLGADKLTWEVGAQERGGAAKDRLRIHQTVREAVPVRTFQATLAQVDAPLAVPVERPAAALPGRGGIAVRFQAKLAGDLTGVREYMEDYPFTCLEQQTSQAVALDDAVRWKAIIARLPAYLDGDGLAKFWPPLREGSDTLTAYLLALAHEAGLALPDDTRQRMSEGLQGFVEGRIRRDFGLTTTGLAAADLAVRKLAALDALSRYGKVEAAWLDSFSITPNLWPASAVLDWIGVLQRSPHLAGRDARLAEARQILRARLDLSGTALGFSSERSDAWWWLMVNGDVNANRLILSAFEGGDWQSADLGRLMRGALARQQRGHWSTTVANAWGVLATRRFSERLETQAVSGVTRAGLGGETVTREWNAQPGPHGLLPWPPARQNLEVAHQGAGRPWVTLASQAAIPLREPIAAGYRITREVSAVEQRQPGRWSRGDVLRVRLEVDAQADMGWVALLDPIPAGATLLGSGLGNDSALLAAGEKRAGGVAPDHEERTHDSFRAYYRFVPKGRFSVEYTLRLNNEGRFNLPPARVEAMYAPERFGETPVAAMEVGP